MSERYDALIIDGGIIGLTTASFLAEEGARVFVVDKGDFGQESSCAGAGILLPRSLAHARTPLDRLLATSAARFPALSAELRERTGIDNGYLRCGGLEIVASMSVRLMQQPRWNVVTGIVASLTGAPCYIHACRVLRCPAPVKGLPNPHRRTRAASRVPPTAARPIACRCLRSASTRSTRPRRPTPVPAAVGRWLLRGPAHRREAVLLVVSWQSDLLLAE